MITLAMSALVAGLTVGGKAIGKTFAIQSSTEIVAFVGRVLHFFGNIGQIFYKKK
jgi:CBS domain containing-hemolysin-like protein